MQNSIFELVNAARRVRQKFGTREDGTPKNWTEWRDLDDAVNAVEAGINAPQNGEMLDLLEEMWVFVAMNYRCHRPWRLALDEWQKKVEKATGWTPANIKTYRATRINKEGDE
jgi:hypothetical protein